jgi:hypothetical protein
MEALSIKVEKKSGKYASNRKNRAPPAVFSNTVYGEREGVL